MADEKRNMLAMLLIMALFTGATIEFSEGSTYAGIALFTAAALLITSVHLTGSIDLRFSGLHILSGFVLVIADMVYNLYVDNGIGTLDSMVFFLGLSFIASGVRNIKMRRIGDFGVYISSVFIVLFLVFYPLFDAFNVSFIHNFDHYFVLVPMVGLVRLIGVPIEVVAIETVRLSGAEDMLITIGGPCSGLYSMFLLIGIVVGYSRIENIGFRKTLVFLVISIAIAYVSNLVRVILLYITAYLYGIDSMMVVHTHLGWIIFALVSGVIIYLIDLVGNVDNYK